MVQLDFCKVTLLLGVFLVRNSSAGVDMELWRTSCPYNEFCTMGSLDEINSTDETIAPCCASCWCEEDCWVFNNCCPDVIHPRPTNLQTVACTTMVVDNGYTLMVSYGEIKYHVVDFCPPGYNVTDQYVVDQCEERFANNTELTDVVAVSDSKNRIYKNRYCAECHGVRDVHMWTLRLRMCDISMGIRRLSVSEYQRKLFQNCFIDSVPSSKMMRQRTDALVCGSSLWSECPSTDVSNDSQSDIIDVCLHGPALQFRKNGERFKNVFCYSCNHGKVSTTTCPAESEIPSRSPFNSYSLLLKSSPIDTERLTQGTQHQCEETEFYVAAKDECLPLFCPPFRVISHGECLDVLESLDNYLVLLRVQYEPITDHVISGDIAPYDNTMAQATFKKMLRYYGLHECHVHEFRVDAFVNKVRGNLSYVTFFITIEIDESCQLDMISNVVRSRLSTYKTISMAINNHNVPLVGHVKFYNKEGSAAVMPYHYERYSRWDLLHIRIGSAFIIDAEYGFFICPFFVFDLQKYVSIINEVSEKSLEWNVTKISHSTRLLHGFYSLTEDSIAVCVDTFVDLYKKGTGSSNMAWPLVYLVGISITNTYLVVRYCLF